MAPSYPPPPPPSYILLVPNPEWTPSTMRGKQPQVTDTTTVTDIQVSTTVIVAPLAEQTGYSSTPTPKPGGRKFDQDDHHGLSSGVIAAAGVIATIIFILVLLGLCVFLCRRSKKTRERAARQQEVTSAQQMMAMKSGNSSNVVDVRTYTMPTIQTPTSSNQSAPISTTSPLSASPSSLPSSQRSAPQVPPVILSTSMGHSYFTGIDTSDHISLADNRSTSNTIDSDEPPPPYRPRSVPPLSRECSVHIANGMVPNYRPGAAISPMEESIQNPFDDPEGDVSDLEDESPRHLNNISIPDDHLSIVSDISYQQEPATTRSSV